VSSAPAPHSPSSIFAGAATVDITPTGSVFLYGYPHVRRFSTGIHDPLECAAFYLKSGAGQALFLANDVICFTRSFVADVRRRIQAECGVPAGSILISATHTHSGPVMTNYLSNGADPLVPKVDPAYLERLAERMVDAARIAVKSAVPAEIGLGLARADGVGTNRHDPAGPSDPEIPVLVARSLASQQPIGCMVVYGMHPTVLHEDSTLISGDFPFFARDYLKHTVLPAHCPVIYHNGASGDQSPRHVTQGNTFAEAKRLGDKLGQAIAAVIPAIVYQSSGAIRVRQTLQPLEPRQFPTVPVATAAVEQARRRYQQLKADGAPRQAVRTAECDVFGAEETAELARCARDGRMDAAIAGSNPAEIQMIEVGPWKFVAWPGEYFVEYCLELKRRLPDTFLITIANGEVQGYIVTDAAAARLVYESTNAIFAPSNGHRMIEATIALAAAGV
jgi:neutral ceramidase